ncbi:hypothetical protein ACFC26_30940 [Kitasatospora purpeofusca]|uniref:hypothetical protein n=1 Tax=Kitasatospora purpeofusca TaxID=67352 RepID=UPI0035DCEAED
MVEVLVPSAGVGEAVGHQQGVCPGPEPEDLGEQVGQCLAVEGQGAVFVSDEVRVGGDVRDAGEAGAADLEDHAASVAADAVDVADVAAGGGLDPGEGAEVAATVVQDG